MSDGARESRGPIPTASAPTAAGAAATRVSVCPQETYGEDPFLSAELAVAFVQGLQGDHPRYVKASAGCKHFSVHGGPENVPVSRLSFDAKVGVTLPGDTRSREGLRSHLLFA